MPELVFEAESHTYEWDGQEVPNVTTIMSTADLSSFGGESDEVTYYMARGRAVHAACQFHDNGTLIEESVEGDDIKVRLEGYRKFKRESGVVILVNEMPLYHKHIRYAGTMDRVAMLGGKICIVDIKAGAEDASHAIQLAAYERLVLQPSVWEELGIPGQMPTTLPRWALHLNDSGKYHLKEYRDPRDFGVFMFCMGIYNWKRRNGR